MVLAVKTACVTARTISKNGFQERSRTDIRRERQNGCYGNNACAQNITKWRPSKQQSAVVWLWIVWVQFK